LSTSAAVQRATQDIYVWSFPGCPLRVHFSIPLIERLVAELNPAAEGVETGGFLIGKSEGAITQVVDFHPVPCDSPGSEYTPSTPATLSRFEESLAQTGSMAVGYYRIQKRGINQLTDDDLAVIIRYFTGPGNIHLVMGPTHEGPLMAGVFFREQEVIYPVSFLEFACDPESLRQSRSSTEPILRFHLDEAEEVPPPPEPARPEPVQPAPLKGRFPRSRVLRIGGWIALGAIVASVVGFLWGRSDLTISKARLALAQWAPGWVQQDPIAESLRLRADISQIRQNLDAQLAENETMKARIRDLDEKLAQLSGARRVAAAAAAKQPPAATLASPSQPPDPPKTSTASPPPGQGLPARESAALNRLPAPAATVRPVAGASSGRLIWTGYLAPGATMTIEGRRASAGSLNGALPQAPLRVLIYPAEFSSGGLSAYSSQPRHVASNAVEQRSAETGWLSVRYVYSLERARALTVIETPGAANGYKLTLQSGDKPASVAVIDWQLVQ
jgi:hypothetical protein